jgi:transcriptional regulator GlxA family with amidase domain
MLDVTLLFLEGGHASTSVGPLEVFEAAGCLYPFFTDEPQRARFRVRTASLDGRPVRAAGAYAIQPDAALHEVGHTDLVFVPSGGADLDRSLALNAPLVDFLRRAYADGAADGARIAGVCTGVPLLAAAGILDGRPATTHWGMVDACRERFPAVDWQPDELVTEADGIYCGAGVHAALDLALYLVEKLADRETAVGCSKALLIDMPRECQAGFAVLPMRARHADDAIKKAEAWIHAHCRESFAFEQLARQLGMSPRNFMRRFKAATGTTPRDYIQQLRIRAAKSLLEGERVTVQEVSEAVGYEDVAFFRALFKRHTGLAPAAYHRRFGGRRAAPGAD